MKTAYQYDIDMDTRWRVDKIPYLKFPTEWEVKIIPPFSGATVRFKVKYNDITCSIYLDCYDNLWCYWEPYRELYSHEDDIFRCGMNETDKLIEAIRETLKQTWSVSE
jgi:hypothetical protein